MAYDSTADTTEHIFQVRHRLSRFCAELQQRGYRHDQSKLGPSEKPLFDEMTPKLKTLVYGTDEYKASLAALGPALAHHYANNSTTPSTTRTALPGSTCSTSWKCIVIGKLRVFATRTATWQSRSPSMRGGSRLILSLHRSCATRSSATATLP